MSAGLLACPQCHAAVDGHDRYCEGCGTELAARIPGPAGAAGEATTGGGPAVRIDQLDLTVLPGRCGQCGGDVTVDGYCDRCGQPVRWLRDRWRERPASWVAALCDRGVRHPHNEDAVAVAAADAPGSFAALVVCDGVSSSTGSDVASLAAARTARNLLVAAAEPDPEPSDPDPAADGYSGSGDPAVPAGGGPSGRRRSRAGSLVGRIVDAGLQANAAVVAAAGDPPRPNPPSCTFACALVEDGLLVAGWVGDSRVYWLPDEGGALQITSDDSWAGEAVTAGIPREDAERAPQAHAITRWFGVDAPDPRPHTVVRHLDGPGWVLVCSDGLWNYCSPAVELQGLVSLIVRRAGTGTDSARLAGELVTWAIEQGGHDNITVALARVL